MTPPLSEGGREAMSAGREDHEDMIERGEDTPWDAPKKGRDGAEAIAERIIPDGFFRHILNETTFLNIRRDIVEALEAYAAERAKDARNQALEEAADMLEKLRLPYTPGMAPEAQNYSLAFQHCAGFFRSLKLDSGEEK